MIKRICCGILDHICVYLMAGSSCRVRRIYFRCRLYFCYCLYFRCRLYFVAICISVAVLGIQGSIDSWDRIQLLPGSRTLPDNHLIPCIWTILKDTDTVQSFRNVGGRKMRVVITHICVSNILCGYSTLRVVIVLGLTFFQIAILKATI